MDHDRLQVHKLRYLYIFPSATTQFARGLCNDLEQTAAKAEHILVFI